MKNLKLVSILLIVVSTAIISCSKGTAGPAGPTGPPGAGDVQHTAWQLLSTAIEGVDANGDTVYSESITAASITQTVLDSGLVLGYIQNPDGSIEDVADLSIFLDVEYALGSINLTSFGVDLTGYNFRYIIVPGATFITSSLRGYSKQQLKTMSYDSVVKLLGIAYKPTN
jgi:hypothetical protein